MQWLTAILAFATTMLVLAIVVSTLVETIHRIFRLRRQGLRLMLENLYAKVIASRLPNDLAKDMTAAKFADLIMQNRASDPAAIKSGKIMKAINRTLQWVAGSTKLDSISVEIFMEKLADSQILGKAEGMTDDVLKDIGQKYTAFGDEVSTYFESRARFFSVVIAFFVAALLYVHPYNLARAYLANPELAQAVAEQAGDTQAQYAVLLEKLENTDDAALSQTDATALRAAIDRLNTDIANGQQEAKKLADLGVPIGWPSADQLKPCAALPWQDDCTFPFAGTTWRAPSVVNAIWLFVGGLLIGLGAPFWAQAVSALSVSRETTRKIEQIVGGPGTFDPPQGAALGTPDDQPAASPPKPTAVRTFEVAQNAARKSPDKKVGNADAENEQTGNTQTAAPKPQTGPGTAA